MAKAAKKKEQESEGSAGPVSFRLDPVIVKKLRYIALMDSKYKSAPQILGGLAVDFVADWERKNGEIKFK